MVPDLVYLVVGLALLVAVVLPLLLRRAALSAPMVLTTAGLVIGLTPLGDKFASPQAHRDVAEHLAEACVLVALMGVGLALDRPLSLRSLSSWRRWTITWRLLGIAMPLCIAGVAVLGWWVMGLAPAAALLLGAVLAPTDPVLASDVQVAGPSTAAASSSGTARNGPGDTGADGADEHTDADEHIDEEDEVRFALTSEAGLNDGLAFPFVYAAILWAGKGSPEQWWPQWVGWYLLGKVLIGLLAGIAVGWLMAAVAFRSSSGALRLAERGEPLLALAVLLISYGAAELAGGYGFIGVFVAAMTMRSMERGHEYHRVMHELTQRLEQMITLIALLLLGIELTSGMLVAFGWPVVEVGVALVFVIRPLAGLVSMAFRTRWERSGVGPVGRAHRQAIAFFGVRGIGSIYYLAYATGRAEFAQADLLWATVGFTIVLSAIVHGIAATPVMSRLSTHATEEQP